MNWKALLNPNLIAMVVAGVQAIHADVKSGADKKTLAMEALGLATVTASQVVSPENQAKADGATEVAAAGIALADAASHKDAQAIASSGIDAAVAAFKLAGAFGFKK
jgi:hypothetical protein